jgi:hypothetical protein
MAGHPVLIPAVPSVRAVNWLFAVPLIERAFAAGKRRARARLLRVMA